MESELELKVTICMPTDRYYLGLSAHLVFLPPVFPSHDIFGDCIAVLAFRTTLLPFLTGTTFAFSCIISTNSFNNESSESHDTSVGDTSRVRRTGRRIAVRSEGLVGSSPQLISALLDLWGREERQTAVSSWD